MEWDSFLSNNANKCTLVQIVTDYILSDESNAPCLNFVTKLDHCILKNTEEFITDVPELPCTHKEADPRLALHAIYTSQSDSVAEVQDESLLFTKYSDPLP